MKSFLRLICISLIITYSNLINAAENAAESPFIEKIIASKFPNWDYTICSINSAVNSLARIEGDAADYIPNVPTQHTEMTYDKKDQVKIINIESQNILQAWIVKTNDSKLQTGHLVSVNQKITQDCNGMKIGPHGAVLATIQLHCPDQNSNDTHNLKSCVGMWPGFWLYNYETGGEIDIFESQVQSSNYVSFSNHLMYWDGQVFTQFASDHKLTDNKPHEYAVEWNCKTNYKKCTITFFQDGNVLESNGLLAQLTLTTDNLDGIDWKSKILKSIKQGFSIVFTQQFKYYAEQDGADNAKNNFYKGVMNIYDNDESNKIRVIKLPVTM